MPPKRANLILPSHIPNVELDILIRDRLDVEADSRDSSDVGVELELVKDRYRHISHFHNQSRRFAQHREPPHTRWLRIYSIY